MKEIAPVIILMNETCCWSEEMVKQGGEMFGAYLFDLNRAVNACEITPSFELTPIGTQTCVCEVLKSRGLDPDSTEFKNKLETFEEEVREADLAANAACDEVRYISCRAVENMMQKNPDLCTKLQPVSVEVSDGASDEEQEAAYREAFAELEEKVKCNQYIGIPHRISCQFSSQSQDENNSSVNLSM